MTLKTFDLLSVNTFGMIKDQILPHSKGLTPVLITQRKRPFENIVGKGNAIGKYHFLLFTTIFSILSKMNVITEFELLLICRLQILSVWTSHKFCHVLTLYRTIMTFNNPEN